MSNPCGLTDKEALAMRLLIESGSQKVVALTLQCSPSRLSETLTKATMKIGARTHLQAAIEYDRQFRTYGAGLIAQVVELVRARGSATADDLLPHLPGKTRAQVMKAMQNAAFKGHIRIAKHRSAGQHKGKAASIYELGEKAQPQPPVSSVWELGQQRGANATR